MTSLTAIRDVVAKAYNVEPAQLLSRSSERTVVEARHVGIYLARKHTDASLEAIVRRFGRSSHYSGIYALARVRKKLESDWRFPYRLRAVEAGLPKASAGEPVVVEDAFLPSRATAFRTAVRDLLEADDAIGLAAGRDDKAAARQAFKAALKTLRTVVETRSEPSS